MPSLLFVVKIKRKKKPKLDAMPIYFPVLTLKIIIKPRNAVNEKRSRNIFGIQFIIYMTKNEENPPFIAIPWKIYGEKGLVIFT